MNYLIVLFKNKKRKKIIKSFITKNKAESYFIKEIEKSDAVKFNIEIENSKKVEYEIALLSLIDESQLTLFRQDEIGRNVKIEIVDSDYKIIKIEKYNLPEKIFDWGKNNRITFDEFFSNNFSTKELKSVFTLNNKIVVQRDEFVSIFSLKNKSESVRFLNCLEFFLKDNNRADGLFVRDLDTIHRKYLYSLLEKQGIDKKRLYRQSTTFSEKK